MPNTSNSRLFTPTVVLFNGMSGAIVKGIKFFDDTCPYIPISIIGYRSRITLIIQVAGTGSGAGIGPDFIGADIENNYPDCQHLSSDGVSP